MANIFYISIYVHKRLAGVEFLVKAAFEIELDLNWNKNQYRSQKGSFLGPCRNYHLIKSPNISHLLVKPDILTSIQISLLGKSTLYDRNYLYMILVARSPFIFCICGKIMLTSSKHLFVKDTFFWYFTFCHKWQKVVMSSNSSYVQSMNFITKAFSTLMYAMMHWSW